MVFRWKITRPAFHQATEGVEVMQPGIEVEFETDSIAEAHGIYQDSSSALGEMFCPEIMKSASDLALSVGGAGDAPKEPKRGRGPNKPKPEAIAPAPLAIPGVEAPPTAPVADPLDIPEAPRRLPPIPPATPAPPPTGILAGKITAELDSRAGKSADGGQALADWLATSGITVKGATYAEAVTVLRLQADEKLGPIAQALGVA